MTSQRTSLDALTARLEAVLSRLAALELAAGVTPLEALAHRQQLILQRLARLEAACGLRPASTGTAAPASGAAAPATAAPAALSPTASLPEVTAIDPSGSEVQQRLQAELLERGISRHKFVRVRRLLPGRMAIHVEIRCTPLKSRLPSCDAMWLASVSCGFAESTRLSACA